MSIQLDFDASLLDYSEEQLENMSVEELEKLQQACKAISKRYFNYEQAVKLTLNSIYGAFGNEYFYFFNVDIAETITKQGKDAILYTEIMINKYFREYWHKDTVLHDKMGIKVIGQIVKPVSKYIDTDSVAGNSILTLENSERVKIEEYWKLMAKTYGYHIDQRGNEIVKIKDSQILNYDETRGLYQAKVAKVVRHKVKKEKWILKSLSGKIIAVTGDHSLVVFRDGKKTVVKANEVNVSLDKILIVLEEIEKLSSIFEEIESCECVGIFEDEYVYDIEMEDKTHTFIANDILVHNSLYLSFHEAIEKSDWKGNELDFIFKIYDNRLKKYIEDILTVYAKKLNSDNYLVFELESVAKSAIWLAKKRYIQDLVWKDPDVHFESLTKIKSKGYETIMSSTPEFARQSLNRILKYVFSTQKIEIDKIVKLLKEIKKEFYLSNIEKISLNLKVNNYSKYIISDYQTFQIEKGCPYHLRGAGYHNYLINNSVHRKKYNLIANADKIKVYYSVDKSCDIFSFVGGSYPYELAPKMDYDTQFERVILDPLNRVLVAVGLQKLDRNLLYSSSVF